MAFFGILPAHSYFYQAEYQINAQVTSYWSALWWSAMNMTTVGCNIGASDRHREDCGCDSATDRHE